MMERRTFIAACAAGLALQGREAAGQRRGKPPRVAVVFLDIPAAQLQGTDPASPAARTFVQALRDLGLVEGRNVIIERRSSASQPERLLTVMQELVALDVDVIVTGGPGVKAAQRATERIPIVAMVDDALDAGIVKSLARPERNVTGFGGNFPGLLGKQMQLLKEAVPAISRVGVIATTPPAGPRSPWRVEIDAAARSMQLDLRWLAVDAPDEFEPAFTTLRERADAILVSNVAINFAHLPRISDLAARHRLPASCSVREFAEAGGLLAYGYGLLDDYRHAAAFVRKILDGARPADLPFEQPTKLELVINLRTAKALGLSIPNALLLRADEVIE